MPEELWTEVQDIVQEAVIKTIPKKKKGKKAKWLSEEAFQIVRKEEKLKAKEKTMDCSLPGSSVHAFLQARILEWVAIFFSRGSFQPRDQTWVFCVAGRFFTI